MARISPKKKPITSRLPARLRRLFWDYEPSRLRWQRDGDLIIHRILTVGDWAAVHWVSARLGDEALRAWLLEHQRAGLSPRQLRFWELILSLPHRQVDAWLAHPSRQAWDGRHRR